MSQNPSLFEALKASYADANTQKMSLGKYGYVRDNELSNDNQQVYYNPIKHKMLYDIAGTHNLKDVGTDIYLAAGHLKDTNRYKEAESTLQKAKDKYHPVKTVGVGHSLGGSVVGYLPVDKSYTLDKGATFGQSIAKNEKAYRTSGDAVSLLNSTNKGMTTLKNPSHPVRTGNPLLDFGMNVLNSHNVDNIKGQSIFV